MPQVHESSNNKLLWDFKIHTDNKTEQKCLIIGVACPFDTRLKDREREN